MEWQDFYYGSAIRPNAIQKNVFIRKSCAWVSVSMDFLEKLKPVFDRYGMLFGS